MSNTLQSSLDAALAPHPHSTLEYFVAVDPASEHDSRKKIIAHVKDRTLSSSHSGLRTHIGVAGFLNWEIMGHTKPDAAIFVDNNIWQRPFWESCTQLLKECPTPLEFRQRLSKQIRRESSPDRDLKGLWDVFYPLHPPSKGITVFYSGNFVSDLLSEFTGQDGDGFGWLRDKEAYRHLRGMALEDRLLCASLDMIHDTETVKAMRGWMGEQNLRPDTIYMSTIYDFMKPKVKRNFILKPTGGIEEAAEQKGEDEVFVASFPFNNPIQGDWTRPASQMHLLVQAFMRNIQTLMSDTSLCFLSELTQENGPVILDGEWAKTYKPTRWPTFDKADRHRGT